MSRRCAKLSGLACTEPGFVQGTPSQELPPAEAVWIGSARLRRAATGCDLRKHLLNALPLDTASVAGMVALPQVPLNGVAASEPGWEALWRTSHL